MQRPFSSNNFNNFQSKNLLQPIPSQDKISQAGSITTATGMHFGKSIANFQNHPGSAIGTMDRIVSALPQPKRPGTTKKKEGEEGKAADKPKPGAPVVKKLP